jgi:hypothetical protein
LGFGVSNCCTSKDSFGLTILAAFILTNKNISIRYKTLLQVFAISCKQMQLGTMIIVTLVSARQQARVYKTRE